MPFDYMSDSYTLFEQNMALAWAGSHFNRWLIEHPEASPECRRDTFFDYVQGGLSLALEFREQNA